MQTAQPFFPAGATAVPPANTAVPPKPLKKRRPIDKQLPRKLDTYIPEAETYAELLRYENKLDTIVSRKKLDLQESLSKPMKTKRTLRVFVSNFSSDQFEQMNTKDESTVGTEGVPSWTLRIEGRLLELPGSRKQNVSLPKFSTFVKAVYVELQRDTSVYPDGNIIEWHKPVGSQDCDGFEIKRVGDSNVPAKIILHLDYAPEKFKLREDLARLLDIHTETKANIIVGLWQYVKANKLQDSDDKKKVNADDALTKIFGVPQFEFPQIPDLLNDLLLPPDPVIIDYTICVDKEYNIGKFAYDIEVEVNDPVRFRMNNFIGGNPALNREIAILEEKISAVIQAVHLSKTKRDFMLAFSKDPVNFLNQFIASQSRDMELMLGDIHVNREECRRGSFWNGDWVNDAIVHYLHSKN